MKQREKKEKNLKFFFIKIYNTNFTLGIGNNRLIKILKSLMNYNLNS